MGGTYWATQTPHVLIGSKSGTTRTAWSLASAYQSEGNSQPTKAFKTSGYAKANFDILYTMGAAESSNSIEVKLEVSPDGTNWYRIPNDSTSTGTSTLTAREFTFVGTDAAAATISIFIDIAYEYMRISCKETGVSSAFGTVYVEATLSGR